MSPDQAPYPPLSVANLADGTTLQLGPWDTVTIPAGTVHRTRALPRAVNLCFEDLDTETTFVDAPIASGDANASS